MICPVQGAIEAVCGCRLRLQGFQLLSLRMLVLAPAGGRRIGCAFCGSVQTDLGPGRAEPVPARAAAGLTKVACVTGLQRTRAAVPDTGIMICCYHAYFAAIMQWPSFLAEAGVRAEPRA
jgi:hypothetical protein